MVHGLSSPALFHHYLLFLFLACSCQPFTSYTTTETLTFRYRHQVNPGPHHHRTAGVTFRMCEVCCDRPRHAVTILILLIFGGFVIYLYRVYGNEIQGLNSRLNSAERQVRSLSTHSRNYGKLQRVADVIGDKNSLTESKIQQLEADRETNREDNKLLLEKITNLTQEITKLKFFEQEHYKEDHKLANMGGKIKDLELMIESMQNQVRLEQETLEKLESLRNQAKGSTGKKTSTKEMQDVLQESSDTRSLSHTIEGDIGDLWAWEVNVFIGLCFHIVFVFVVVFPRQKFSYWRSIADFLTIPDQLITVIPTFFMTLNIIYVFAFSELFFCKFLCIGSYMCSVSDHVYKSWKWRKLNRSGKNRIGIYSPKVTPQKSV